MKVLHVGKYFLPQYGGIETFMSQLMEEQAIQGLEVAAIVHVNELRSATGEYNWKGCKIFEVRSYGSLVFAPVAPAYPYRLLNCLKMTKPDIIHVHMPNLSAFWLLFTPLFGAKIVIHWHSDVLGASPNKWVKFFYPFYRAFEYSLLRKSQAVIATSPNYLESSEPLKPFTAKCSVVPLGIKIDKNIEIKKKAPESTLCLIMIGRLTYYKNHKQVIDAISELNKKGHAIRLDIVGDGELRESLENQIIERGAGDVIKMHGKVSDETKNQLLRDCDLLLLPSTERTEAFGVVLLEAALHAKPALVSDVAGSGMSHVIDDEKTGIVCSVNNKDEFKEKLIHCSENRDKLHNMGMLNHQKLLSDFDIKVITDKISADYQGCQDAI